MKTSYEFFWLWVIGYRYVTKKASRCTFAVYDSGKLENPYLKLAIFSRIGSVFFVPKKR